MAPVKKNCQKGSIDVPDIFSFFFCSGRGKGDSEAPGRGGGSVFLLKIPGEGGGVPGGGGGFQEGCLE